MSGYAHLPVDTFALVVYDVIYVSDGFLSTTLLASAPARSLPVELLCALNLPRCMRADARGVAGFESVDDGVKRLPVDVVSKGSAATHEALHGA
jgi:hypothetical protein